MQRSIVSGDIHKMNHINLENVKAGTLFWESSQHGNYQMLALEDGKINDQGYVSVRVLCANDTIMNVGYLKTSPYRISIWYDSPVYSGVREHTFLPLEDNLLTQQLRQHFTDNQIRVIFHIVENTCRYCKDSDRRCQCWNDE